MPMNFTLAEEITGCSVVKPGQFPGVEIEVRSAECCGWVNVSNLGCTLKNGEWVPNPRDLEVIKKLMTGECFVPEEEWSGVEDEAVNFPLFLVLGNSTQNLSTWGKELEALGWIKCTPFYNPNTGNINTPYQYIPEECKVD